MVAAVLVAAYSLAQTQGLPNARRQKLLPSGHRRSRRSRVVGRNLEESHLAPSSSMLLVLLLVLPLPPPPPLQRGRV